MNRRIERAKKKAKAKTISKMMGSILTSSGRKKVAKELTHELNS